MVITCGAKIILKKILISEKELRDINFERLKNALVYIKKKTYLILMITCIYANNIITGSNNITLRKVNVRQCGSNKMYIIEYLIEDKIY